MRTSSFRSSTILAGGVLLAACNLVFGLDETIADRDGDGVADVADNCVGIANGNQVDSDGDGIGDACAACAMAIGSDLDRDGYDEGCDRCIGPGPTGSDADGDGIDDGCDACIAGVGTTGIDADANGIDDGCELCFDPIGVDVDGDGLDDRCDVCLSGPPHDEDHDGTEDGCDNCPGDVNADQASAGDGVGSACDPDAQARQDRVLFDPFIVVDTATWTNRDLGWSVSDDAARADGVTISQLANVHVTRQFSVATRLADAPTGSGGVFLANSPLQARVSCGIDSAGVVTLKVDLGALTGSGATTASSAPTTFDPSKSIHLRLRATPQAGAVAPRYQCVATVDGVATIVSGAFTADVDWLVGLFADGEATFEWFDAMTGT